MPTWLDASATVVLFALCLACARIGPGGWKTWPRPDRLNYLALCVAAWPWLLWGFFATPAAWFSAAAAVLFAGSLIVLMIRQLQFLRESRAVLARAQALAGELRGGEQRDGQA